MRRSNLATLILAVMVTVLTGAWARPAAAQGMREAIPDPITSAELADYAERLYLSEIQLGAALEFHERYKTQYAAIRDRDIEKLLDDLKALRSLGPHVPSRDTVEDLKRQYERIINKIETIDRQFFGQLESVVSPQQAMLVPKVSRLRERQRYGNLVLLQVVEGGRADLTEIVRGLDLAPDEALAVQPILDAYEVTLTRTTKDVYEKTIEVAMAMYDAIVASEIGQMENIEDMQADPMAMMKAMNIIRNAWKKNNLEFIKTAGELVELNRRTHRQLASVLQRDSARALRRAFHRKAYRRVATGNDFADRQFERVLKHADDMSPDIVEAVRLAFDRFDDVEQRLSAEMCDELDAIRRSRREAPFDQMFQPVSQDKFNAVRERRDEVSRAAIEELSLLLGDERFAALVGEDDGAAAPMALGNVTLSSDAGGTVAVSVSAAEMPGTPRSSRDGGSDDYLPPPIRAATLDRYLRDLGATADQAAIAGMLHEDYLAAWDQVEQTDVAAMKAAQASIWSDEGGDRESRIEAADTLRRRALDAMLALDARLFNDLGATVLDAAQLPRLERIRLRRERIVYNRSDQSSNMFGGGTREGDLDLSVLVDEIVADASRTPADDLLAEYERDVHAHIIARYQQRLAFSKMNVMLTARMQREQGVNYWQEIQPGLRKVREAGDAIAALNRSYAPRITAALPAESARLFREQYKRRAFPGIYEERNIARQRFDDVSRLDLSVPQRRRLEAMEAEFEAKYDAACDKLVELAMVDSGFPMSENPEEWNDWQDRQVVRQRLNFEREELGQAAVLRLRTLLDEQQRSLVNMDVIDHRDSPWD